MLKLFLGIALLLQALLLVGSVGVHMFEPSYFGPYTNTDEVLRGEKVFNAQGCQKCHGDHGLNPVADNYPVLAGQRAPYLVAQMQDIRDGRRNNSFSSVMRPVLSELTDNQIRDIAAYLSSIER